MPTRTASSVSTLGRYSILGRIASGGMATVYMARLADTAHGFSREFALKVIHPHLVEEDGFSARFLQEARLAARVRHPNVVRTVDAGEDQGYAFMALELIDGVNLRQLALHRSRPFAPPQAAAIVTMVARGLEAVHSATDTEGAGLGMVHRDISPHNVMLDRSGRAILIDLGLARPDRTTGLTQVGVLAGKLPYMSPEQSRLEALDGRSDIFSMGTLLFELTTGDLPFGDTHSAQTMTRLEVCDPKPIAAKLEEAEVPAWLADIVLACLRCDREDRLPSAAALAEALAQELSAAGYDEARLRSVLANIVEDGYQTLGTVEIAEPLPRIAHAATSGPAPIVASGSGPARPVFWAAAAIALAGIVGVGAWTLRGHSSRAASDSTETSAAGSLSKDQASPTGEPAAVDARDPLRSPQVAPPAARRDAVEPGLEVDLEPPPKPAPRQRRAKTRATPDALKPNPYDPS